MQEALNEVREYLIALLEEKRRPLSCCSPPSPIPSSTPSPSSFSESEMEESEVEEGGRGRGRGGKKGSLLEEEIDTALMRAYGWLVDRFLFFVFSSLTYFPLFLRQ